MFSSLNAGAIHVSLSSLDQAIHYCTLGGFEGLSTGSQLFESMPADAAKAALDGAGIKPGAFGLPIDFRNPDSTTPEGLAQLEAVASKMRSIGFRHSGTWILPGSNDHNFDANWEFHVRQLKPICEVLGRHGITFGLEFIGPKSLRDSFRYPFVHTLHLMRVLAEKIGENAGILLDAWHLSCSGASADDIRAMDPSEIALVHINDAPVGVEVDDRIDNRRELPCATGVLDLKGFMDALRAIHYTGPVEAEPFDDTLKTLASDEERVIKTGKAVRAAFLL